MLTSRQLRARRAQRIRSRLRKKKTEGVPRLAVFRSNKNIYAQVIDDLKGETLASASTLEPELRGSLKSGATAEAAAAIGKRLAERAVAKGLSKVVFDRGGYLYHGRVKALAEAAREGGLNF